MKKVLFQHIKFNTDWGYKNKETGAYFKCGIIKSKVFYISFGGKIEFIDVQKIDKIITQIIIDGKFKNSAHFRIVDLNRNVKISFFARDHLIKTFNSLYKKFNCTPIISYICTQEHWIKPSLLFAEKLMNHKFILIPNVNDAFQEINQGKNSFGVNEYSDNKIEETITVQKKEIDSLLYLSSISVWNTTGNQVYQNIHIPDDSPLSEVYEAIKMIISDKNEILEKEKSISIETNNNLNRQKLLADASFLFAESNDFDNRINSIMQLIGSFTNVSSIYVFENFDNGKFAKNTFEWHKKNIEPKTKSIQSYSYQDIPSLKKISAGSGQIFSKNTNELPKDLISNFNLQKIKCFLVLPIYLHNNFYGFIRFDDYENEKSLNDETIELLKTIATIIAVIVEQKVTYQKREETEAKYKAISNSANDGIILMDSNGNVSYWNNAAEKIFGYAQKEVIGKNLHKLLTPQKYRDAQDKAMLNFRETGNGDAVGKTLEVEAKGKNGEIFPIELSLSRLKINGLWNTVGIVKDIRERKFAEEKLRLSENKLKIILDSVVDLIFIVTKSGKQIYFNNQLKQITGYEIDECIGKSFTKFVPKKEIPKYFKKIKEVLQQKKITAFESEIISKNGTIVPVEIRGNVINYNNESLILGSMSDIRERKKAELAIIKSERKFSQLLKRLNDIVFEIDLNSKVLFVNPIAEKIIGKPLTEILSTPFHQFYDRESQIKIYNAYKEISEQYKSGNITNNGLVNLELKLTNGKTIVVRTTPIIGKDGKLVGHRGVGRDITEQKKAELALLESEKKFKIIFEKSNDALLIIDNGKFIDCNQAFVNMFGAENKETILNYNISRLSPEKQPDGKPSVEKANEMMEIAFENGFNHFEWMHLRINGSEFPAEVWFTAIKYENKKIIHTVCRDVSEQKERESEIEQYQNKLEELVFKRTEELMKYQEKLEDMVAERTLQFQQSEERYRILAENSDDIIMRFDINNRYLYINSAVTKLMHIEPSDFIGKTHEELQFPKNLCELWDSTIQDVFATKLKKRLEFQLPNNLWIDWALFPELDNKGKVRTVLGTARDITELKKDEELLRTRAKELEMFNETMLNRELRVIELKEEINKLYKEMNKQPPYPPIWKDAEKKNEK